METERDPYAYALGYLQGSVKTAINMLKQGQGRRWSAIAALEAGMKEVDEQLGQVRNTNG